jgi:anionic cell wall polymer biosynthesis LytR-Cps2A-Psr (LCP) family protein
MDGQTALWYVRSRYSTSDFDRTRRSQEVALGIFYKLISLNAVARAPDLYNQFRKNVETNMSPGDIALLLPTAVQIAADPSRIHRYAIGTSEVIPYITPGGASVLLPRHDLIISLIQRALKAQ